MNTTFKKILVPVDVGSGVPAALGVAAAMARAFHASVELFHVWQPPSLINAPLMVMSAGLDSRPIALEDLARDAATTELKAFVAHARELGVSDASGRVGIGNPAHEILSLAACGYDLIVMGTHGRGGMAHAFLGSVAEKVVRRASCPVLTVRSSD